MLVKNKKPPLPPPPPPTRKYKYFFGNMVLKNQKEIDEWTDKYIKNSIKQD